MLRVLDMFSGLGGIQGETDPAIRAMVPYQLALDVCLAMEEWASSSWDVMSAAWTPC